MLIILHMRMNANIKSILAMMDLFFVMIYEVKEVLFLLRMPLQLWVVSGTLAAALVHLMNANVNVPSIRRFNLLLAPACTLTTLLFRLTRCQTDREALRCVVC